MTIKAIIFDWDGTLARTLELWLEGYVQSFENHGYSFAPEVIAREFFYNHHEVPRRHPQINFPLIVDATRAHVLDNAHTVALYDNARDVLDGLAAQAIDLSLVTSSPRGLLEKALGPHDLAPYYRSIVAGDDGFGHKPDTRPFEETLDRLGAAAGETLIVGDAAVDIAAGQALGCRTCWFAPGQNRLFHDFNALEASGCDHRIEDLKELLEVI